MGVNATRERKSTAVAVLLRREVACGRYFFFPPFFLPIFFTGSPPLPGCSFWREAFVPRLGLSCCHLERIPKRRDGVLHVCIPDVPVGDQTDP